MEKRETYLDAICGVIIIWMVLGHIFQAAHLTESATYLCLSQILFFFMPWFCFKAGMFEKTMPDKVCFEKNFKRLMIPYFVFTGIGCIVHPISLYIASDPEILKHAILSPVKGILVDGRTTANAPVWFLFSLFVAKMLYNRFHSKYFTPMVLVSLAIPTAMFYLGIKIPYYLAYISTTLFFYSCGAKLRNVQYQKAVLLASLAVLAFSYFVLPTFVDMHRNRLLWGIYPFWFVSSLAGIVVINNLFKKFGGGGVPVPCKASEGIPCIIWLFIGCSSTFRVVWRAICSKLKIPMPFSLLWLERMSCFCPSLPVF